MEKVEEAILILSWLLLAVSSGAEIITVDVDGSADFTNILAAIDAAKDGDVELTVIGRFISGQYFHSSGTVTIVNPNDDDG